LAIDIAGATMPLCVGCQMVFGERDGLGVFPYLFALLLSGGSLLIYLLGAVVSRYGLEKDGRTTRAFNLGVPATQNPETLFAVSLAAAQTTFSTVFVVFLTGGPHLGFHLLYCPIAFAFGNWFMLQVYRRIDAQGYIDRSSISGLIPYFFYRLTRNRFISYFVAALCLLPIVAILALELHYGIPVLDYLGQRVLPLVSVAESAVHPLYGAIFRYAVFACFMVFLLGYVFVGGFRAVVTSDVWQYRIMLTTLSLALLSVAVLVIRNRHALSWETLGQSSGSLISFYVGVTIIDLFQPLCFATTWQRFRAFRDRSTNFDVAVVRASSKVVLLWFMLIFIGVGMQLVSPAPPNDDLTRFFDRVAQTNLWFRLFVFPLLILAGFSGMYSSADTCVSALLYLTETNRGWRVEPLGEDVPLRRHYNWVMGGIFLLTSSMYLFVRHTSRDPAQIALMIFGNAVILAPALLLITTLAPSASEKEGRLRSAYIGASVTIGFIAYWFVTCVFPNWSIASGLLTAAVPAYLLLRRERQAAASKSEERMRANA
jgi:hypothetical protein